MKGLINRLIYEQKGESRWSILLLGMALIAITAWFFTSDIYTSVDILFWDEVNYLNSGKQMFAKFNNQWGPSYAVWFKLLSFFESDTLKLYFLNYRLMTLLPAMALFGLLATSNVRIWIAFSVSLLFLFAQINLPVWPKISHYVVFVFLMGMIVMRFLPTTFVKLAFMSLVSLFIAFSRPEFYLTYLSILGLSVLALIFDSTSRNLKVFLPAVAMIGLSFLVQLVIGNPLFNFQGDRSALAFAQHFMLNYFEWNGIDQDFWITWMSYYESEFGNASSLKEAFAKNGDLFIQHVTCNIQGYVTSGYRLFSDVMLPEKIVALPLAARMLVLVLGGAISITILGKKKYLETLTNNLQRNMLIVLLLLLFVGPSLIACVLIYPREHYMFLHVPIVILIACLMFFSQPTSNKPTIWLNTIPALGFLALCWCIMPSTKGYDYFDLWRKENSQANLKTVEKLRAYNFSAPVRIIENEGGINLFLSNNYTWIRGFMKDRPWVDYIAAEQVNMVYVTPSLEKYPTLQQDTTWPDFKQHPEKYGFREIRTGEHQPYLLISENLLRSLHP